jgi:2,4-dienoyl-CoA reductase-like NADH-dependent reductase (Old Yellow Enzyme family)
MSKSPDPFAPVRLGRVPLRNRIIRAATFEGMAGDQTVSDRLIEFHRQAARGGVGMTPPPSVPYLLRVPVRLTNWF